ncbi:hypothetical protein BCR44DRAFT_92223 [Catenaria anguillulae PL171]|uniref:Uncharacterized protein n=1 Tax=Catenaria anguillulae PL171 TaxID=765915 RepID=A0A1Y2I1G9_9FUNG|nr:hypothetical protein BCR44DRAFT_92223 [Catenaria anguillulae PL171]
MRYGDAIERDYSEVQRLRRQLAHAESLAARVQSQLKDREKTIIHLQRKLRAKIFTHLADLTPTDLAVPDDMFPEADASGLYNLNRHQLVHLLLKKETVIRGLVRRVWATKLERDQWMLRTHEAQRARGVAAGEGLGGKVRQYYSEVQQWAFADRSKAGVDRVEERMDRAVRRQPQRKDLQESTQREYLMRERIENWMTDPVELGPLVDLGGNGYYGRRPEHGTVREMMDEEQDSVLWNVSEDEDGDPWSKGKSHTKTPDPFALPTSSRREEDDGWCATKYVRTALAANFKGVDKVKVVENNKGSSHGVGLSLKQAPAVLSASEPVGDVDPSFWLPDEAASSLVTLQPKTNDPPPQGTVGSRSIQHIGYNSRQMGSAKNGQARGSGHIVSAGGTGWRS